MNGWEEDRLRSIEDRLSRLERGVPVRLGPRPETEDEKEHNEKELNAVIAEALTRKDVPPVDRTQRTLTDGRPVPENYEHTQDRGDGQQKGYIVLTPEERAKGFVRPVRDTYLHKPCGTTTHMGQALAETYARDPGFYSGTFCVKCKSHFQLDQFVWQGTDQVLGT